MRTRCNSYERRPLVSTVVVVIARRIEVVKVVMLIFLGVKMEVGRSSSSLVTNSERARRKMTKGEGEF